MCQVQIQTRKASHLKDRTRKRYTCNTAHEGSEDPGLSVNGALVAISCGCRWKTPVELVRASKACWFNDCWTVERPCHCHQAAWVQWSSALAGEVIAPCGGMTLRSWLLTMMEHSHSCSSLGADGLLESVMVSLWCSNGFLLHCFFHFPFEINGNVCIHNSQIHGLPQFNPPLHDDYLLQILNLVPAYFILSISIIF